ncbi:MAG: class I SAM-dependent methyltransferase [Candidatus Pacebacteria bacterium]|nr:class I SAM-dependent methyltransferase [Candidatus Paceibacterota bacterium]
MNQDYARQLSDKVKSDYNRIAEDFSNTRHLVWQEIDFLFDYIKPDDKVLDSGCGNGRYSPLIKARGGRYFGVDSSEELIKIAKSRYPAEDFQTADVLNLPFANDFFDKIYSIAVLHHIPSRELRLKFFSEAERALKKNGLLVLTVWKFKRWQERVLLLKYNILRALGKSKLERNDLFLPWQNKIPRYYHFFNEQELRKLAGEAGFEIVKSGIVSNERGNRNNVFLVARKL